MRNKKKIELGIGFTKPRLTATTLPTSQVIANQEKILNNSHL